MANRQTLVRPPSTPRVADDTHYPPAPRPFDRTQEESRGEGEYAETNAG
ncbi:MAG TPA: hypothetical protein VHH10_12230 [Rubrobacteraceae bacterium]|nr:hypothetical protein [Rubrobacteraceae bacterium]